MSRGCDLLRGLSSCKWATLGWGEANTGSLLLESMVCSPALASVKWYGSVVVVIPEQVCEELHTGRQGALPCLGR